MSLRIRVDEPVSRILRIGYRVIPKSFREFLQVMRSRNRDRRCLLDGVLWGIALVLWLCCVLHFNRPLHSSILKG